jgi:hypothetical protein
LAEDAARQYDASIRVAECRVTDRCDVLARINGSCYVSNSTGNFDIAPYDCAKSNDEILAEHDSP